MSPSDTAWMTAMKRSTDPNSSLPVHDYEPALQRAVSWLGERHLLATPSVRLPADQIRHRFLARPLAAATRVGTNPAVRVH
jgi:hypothetical protein